MPLYATASCRGYKAVTQEITVNSLSDQIALDTLLEAEELPDVPFTDLRYEGTCIDSVNNPSEYDNDLIAHPKVCLYRGEYIMFYTARCDKSWATAAAVSKDGINWERKGIVISGWTIDPGADLRKKVVYTAQPHIVDGRLFAIAGYYEELRFQSEEDTLYEIHAFTNDGDPLNGADWKHLNDKPFLTSGDLWGASPQDARIYKLSDPPVVNGQKDAWWMQVIANPKTRRNVEAQFTVAFSAPRITGPWRFVSTSLKTDNWYTADWPGAIIRIDGAYYWLTSRASSGPLNGENAWGLLYKSDDFLNWTQVSQLPLIRPQPYPAFDDKYTAEFDFEFTPDKKRVLLYYASRSLDIGKKCIACYSFSAEGKNIDLLKSRQ
jgi:hypothetical protein